jgi:hypothetical protein
MMDKDKDKDKIKKNVGGRSGPVLDGVLGGERERSFSYALVGNKCGDVI